MSAERDAEHDAGPPEVTAGRCGRCGCRLESDDAAPLFVAAAFRCSVCGLRVHGIVSPLAPTPAPLAVGAYCPACGDFVRCDRSHRWETCRRCGRRTEFVRVDRVPE